MNQLQKLDNLEKELDEINKNYMSKMKEDNDKVKEEIKEEIISDFDKIYSYLTKLTLDCNTSCIINDCIYNNHKIIYKKKYDNDGNTMLQLCVKSNNYKLLKLLLQHPKCTRVYLRHTNKKRKDFMMMSLENSRDNFENTVKIIMSVTNRIVHQYFKSILHKIFYILVDNSWNDLLITILESYPDSKESLCTPWAHCPEKFKYSTPISYLINNELEQFDDKTTYMDFFKSITELEWVTKDVFNNYINILYSINDYATIILIFNNVNNNIKENLVKLIINNYFDISCLKNIVIEEMILNKNVIGDESRLFLILKHGDDLQLKQLLTIDNFSEEEYMYKDDGLNCIYYAIMNNPELINILLSSDYFNNNLLKDIDKDGNNINYYIRTYSKNNNYIRNLYNFIYPEPVQVSEGNEGELICKICFENNINIVLLPCGHTHCSKCINYKIIKCPFCDLEIEDYQILHLS